MNIIVFIYTYIRTFIETILHLLYISEYVLSGICVRIFLKKNRKKKPST